MALVACASSGPEKGQHAQAEPRETLITPQPPAVKEPKQKRPNVLVIEADDMRWDDLRFMPNVQRLLQRRGPDLRELVRAVPAVLPVAGQLPHRPVRPQPPRLQPRGAVRLQVVPRPAHDRDGAAEGGLPDGPGRQVPQRVRRAADPRTGASSLHYVPPGWTDWMAGQRPPVALVGPVPRRHLRLLQPDAERERRDQVVPRSLLDRRARCPDPQPDHQVRPWQGALVRVVDPGRAAPRLARRARRPADESADGR